MMFQQHEAAAPFPTGAFSSTSSRTEDEIDLQGLHRVVLVTGGTEGVGAVISRKMKELGYTVAVTYTNRVQARTWQDRMEREGYLFFIYPCDLTDMDSTQRMVREVTKDLGPIDTLVNAAGREFTGEERDSAFNVTCVAMDGMIAQGFGRIINISFAAPRRTGHGRSLLDFTWEISSEIVKRGVTINTVSFDDATGAESPENAAAIVAFLAAKDSGHVNGTNIPVRGQHTKEERYT
jgi:acetoacetyl-CoA reductase